MLAGESIWPLTSAIISSISLALSYSEIPNKAMQAAHSVPLLFYHGFRTFPIPLSFYLYYQEISMTGYPKYLLRPQTAPCRRYFYHLTPCITAGIAEIRPTAGAYGIARGGGGVPADSRLWVGAKPSRAVEGIVVAALD